MHQRNARQHNSGRPERFESNHRPRHSFDRTVLLLLHIIEILHLAYLNRGAVLTIIALNGRGIGPALVNRDLLRQTVVADGSLQEAPRGRTVPLLGEQEVNSLAHFVHRPVQVLPLALNFDVHLVEPPAFGDRRICWRRASFDPLLPVRRRAEIS